MPKGEMPFKENLNPGEYGREHFPKVAESLRVVKRDENYLEMDATVRSFGQTFPVKMKTRILPGKGFISDNDSLKFGTSGHEELLLSERPEGTMIDYIIDELRKRLER